MGRAALKAGRVPVKKRTKLPDDMPTYAVGHPIKLATLIALHEKDQSAVEIADRLGVDVRLVTNHLRDLYDAGCIEFVGYRAGTNNIPRAVYRAIARPLIDDETHRAMSQTERRASAGVVVQWVTAECFASYRSGKIDQDDDVCLISDEPNLDTEGRQELRKLLTAIYDGELDSLEAAKSIQAIEGRAANRMAESGEKPTTMFVALMAFERGSSSIGDLSNFQR
ncbi:MAG: Bacterial regulatory protein arsR family [Solirubrobacterales bacterium]|nr:Bacterial regulatory protein arsR family [Solirubrobacterales bacterium]